MKVSASIIVAAAALGVSARPSGHAHIHKERDYIIANQPTSTSAAYVAPAATSSPASSKGTSSSGYVEFCKGENSNPKRATLYDIHSVGNTGYPTYGCNMMTIDESIADLYDYTATFNNDVDKDQACVCWNKIGPDRVKLDGMWKGNQAINFTLPASGKKVVAFQSDSQGGCACTVGSEPAYTSFGQFASTWLEFDFCSTKNSGWSGADASALVPIKYGLDIPALKVCVKDSNADCSIIGSKNIGSSNAYDHENTITADGIGFNLNTKTVHYVCTVGK